MSLVSAGIVVGALGAGMTAGPVVAVGGWQGLFVVPGLFAAVLSIVLWWVLPGVSAPQQGVASRSRVPQFELFSAPWRFPIAVYAGA
jgi:cyanate permease